MTTNEQQAHVLKMQSARHEFAEFWRLESQRRFLQQVGESARVEFEITAWNAFLKGKGLK